MRDRMMQRAKNSHYSHLHAILETLNLFHRRHHSHRLCSFAVRSPLHRCSATDPSSLSLSSVRLHHRGRVSVSVCVCVSVSVQPAEALVHSKFKLLSTSEYVDDKKLFLAILDNQNLGKLAECAQSSWLVWYYINIVHGNGHEALHLISSLAETFVFIYMGIDIAMEKHSWSHVGFIFFSVISIGIARTANVFCCAYLINLVRPQEQKTPEKYQKALWYSG
ncbi:hypothetical protein PIB30_014647 [Stylosanthes scabra]|uniref:Cation/H+ exchanger domain-containing protein n=1 Tax=Stylosanthes scabra TaxID=79078 RepID=A0ABU6S662_9FABA|nr:hypothetical protein [Stylosanthes scabra]